MFEQLLGCNAHMWAPPKIDARNLFYTEFSHYPDNNNIIYDLAGKRNFSSNITKTLTNAQFPGKHVAYFDGNSSFPVNLIEPIGTQDYTMEIWVWVTPTDAKSAIMMFMSTMTNSSGGGTGHLSLGTTKGLIYSPANYGDGRGNAKGLKGGV